MREDYTAKGIELIVLTIACASLAAHVERYYYASCVTCRAQTFCYVPIIVYALFACAYFGLVHGANDSPRKHPRPKKH